MRNLTRQRTYKKNIRVFYICTRGRKVGAEQKDSKCDQSVKYVSADLPNKAEKAEL